MNKCIVVATESHNKPHTPQAPSLRRHLLAKELAQQGVRLTAQRRLLVDLIQQASRHLDAATLLRIAQKQEPGINRATVYRTLAMLKRRGLIDELDLMHLEGEKHFYEARTDRDHCHLACFRCGTILEYSSAALDSFKREIARQAGFDIAVMRLEVGGVCRRCRKAEITGKHTTGVDSMSAPMVRGKARVSGDSHALAVTNGSGAGK
jgi:Fur family ferric uptake transcriptional regulator